ncbi:MAG: ribosome biogenesis GTPase Der [Burkholderiales bacterium]
MKPVLALVGRPNVGKSTLFNRLTRSRDALVADIPGLTRDRHYGHGRLGDIPFLAVDTGGFEPDAREGIVAEMARQAREAIAESDVVLFLTDGRAGVTGQDHTIAAMLRKTGKRAFVAVNKTEGMGLTGVANEFHELGLGAPIPISSAHGDNVRELLELALEPHAQSARAAEEAGNDRKRPRIAIAGRPNVGKSTLVNTLLGEERVIAFDQPGTTRDAIAIDFEYRSKSYTLIDTAGLRKRGKVFETIEKFSVIKTMQAISDANVVVLVLDARQDIADQDAHIAGFIVESGRALVVAINKWDGLDSYTRERVRHETARKLKFLDYAETHTISAKQGVGIGAVMKSVDAAYAAAVAHLPTPKITRALQEALARQQPPRSGVYRPRMRYAHQGGSNPPIIVVHGNSLKNVPDTYRRYLEGFFRDTFALKGTPLRVQFKAGRNPYAEA